jgi:hypothetical protein
MQAWREKKDHHGGHRVPGEEGGGKSAGEECGRRVQRCGSVQHFGEHAAEDEGGNGLNFGCQRAVLDELGRL